jgi:hypothetical protein
VRWKNSGVNLPPWLEVLEGSGTPSFIQLARGGEWERARRLPLASPLTRFSDRDDIFEWATGDSDLALEIFLGDDLDASFLGVRPPWSARRFAELVFELQHELVLCPSAVAVVQLLRQRIQSTLFVAAPDKAELGVVNAWQTSRSVQLWRRGGRVPDHAELRAILAAAPQFHGERSEPSGLELVWRAPVKHWLGLGVSARVAGGYRVDVGEIDSLLKRVILQRPTLRC